MRLPYGKPIKLEISTKDYPVEDLLLEMQEGMVTGYLTFSFVVGGEQEEGTVVLLDGKPVLASYGTLKAGDQIFGKAALDRIIERAKEYEGKVDIFSLTEEQVKMAIELNENAKVEEAVEVKPAEKPAEAPKAEVAAEKPAPAPVVAVPARKKLDALIEEMGLDPFLRSIGIIPEEVGNLLKELEMGGCFRSKLSFAFASLGKSGIACPLFKKGMHNVLAYMSMALFQKLLTEELGVPREEAYDMMYRTGRYLGMAIADSLIKQFGIDESRIKFEKVWDWAGPIFTVVGGVWDVMVANPRRVVVEMKNETLMAGVTRESLAMISGLLAGSATRFLARTGIKDVSCRERFTVDPRTGERVVVFEIHPMR